MDRASRFEREGREFDPLRAHRPRSGERVNRFASRKIERSRQAPAHFANGRETGFIDPRSIMAECHHPVRALADDNQRGRIKIGARLDLLKLNSDECLDLGRASDEPGFPRDPTPENSPLTTRNLYEVAKVADLCEVLA